MQPSNHQVSLSQKQNMIRHSVVRASDQIKEGRGFESHLGSDFFPSLHFMQKTYHILKLRRFIYLTRSIQRITRLKRIILLQCEIAIETHFLLSILLALPLPPPPAPLSTSKQFVGNGQKLVKTRESWKIQRKGNNVLAGKRKRVLVRKTRPLATLLSILSVVTISFLFQIHLFILWQNSRIVASRLRCSSRIHFSTQSVQNCLLFPSFCEMKLEVKEHRGLFMTSQT